MTTKLELLPCPHCGGGAEHAMGRYGNGKPWPYVQCLECTASSEPDMWNRRAPADPSAEAVAPTEEMVEAYLKANDAYWRETDAQPQKMGKWRNGTPSEATRFSLIAALAAAPTSQREPGSERAAVTEPRMGVMKACKIHEGIPYQMTVTTYEVMTYCPHCEDAAIRALATPPSVTKDK